jgi:hypothetical protein
MKLLKLLTLSLLTVTAIGSFPASGDARTSTSCYSVDAKRGWQYLQLSNTYSRVTHIRGSWTVDVLNLNQVGPQGYSNLSDIEGYDGFTYDETIPLGALLVGVPGSTYSWLNEPQALLQPVNVVALRINDDDFTLGNNFGSLQVCFGN